MRGMQTNHPVAAPKHPPLTEDALCAWVGTASPGDQLAYHCGFLAFDVGPDSKTLSPAARQQLDRVARRARKQFEQGLVYLLQRRDGPGEYTYLIISRRRPRGADGALDAVLDQAELSPGDITLRRSA
jgi:hypothetical protein